jgi:hypothetical protein
MGMLNFNAYSTRELQNFIAMLNQCESNGVSDIRFVRERLQNHITSIFREGRIKIIPKKEDEVCPECGDSGWKFVEREGVMYHACPECRYSKEVL